MVDSRWPPQDFNTAAEGLASSVWELAITPADWIIRRREVIELSDPGTVRRSTMVEFVLPDDSTGQGLKLPGPGTQYLVPLGFVPKQSLRRLRVENDAIQLDIDHIERLAVSLARGWLEESGTDPLWTPAILQAVAQLIRDPAPGPDAKDIEAAADQAGAIAAVFPRGDWHDRVLFLARSLQLAHPQIFAVEADPGRLQRIEWAVDDILETSGQPLARVGVRPLTMRFPAMGAMPYQPAYDVEFVAPEGLEIEDAGIVQIPKEGSNRRLLASIFRDRAGGRVTTAHVHIPRGSGKGFRPLLIVHLGYDGRTLPRNAAFAALAIFVLLTVFGLSTESVKSASGGYLLTAPALLLGVVAGYTAPSITMRSADWVRALVLGAVVLAMVGGTLVLLADDYEACAPALLALAGGAGALSSVAVHAWRRKLAPLDE